MLTVSEMFLSLLITLRYGVATVTSEVQLLLATSEILCHLQITSEIFVSASYFQDVLITSDDVLLITSEILSLLTTSEMLIRC